MSLVNDSGRASDPDVFDEIDSPAVARKDGAAPFTLTSDTWDEARGTFAGIVFNRPIEQILTYRVPPRWVGSLGPGQRVKAPLGRSNKPEIGHCVWIQEGLPAEELEAQKRQLKGQIMLGLESPVSRMARLAGHALSGERYRTLDELLTEVDGVTGDEVGALAAEFFAPERQTMVRLGPPA